MPGSIRESPESQPLSGLVLAPPVAGHFFGACAPVALGIVFPIPRPPTRPPDAAASPAPPVGMPRFPPAPFAAGLLFFQHTQRRPILAAMCGQRATRATPNFKDCNRMVGTLLPRRVNRQLGA